MRFHQNSHVQFYSLNILEVYYVKSYRTNIYFVKVQNLKNRAIQAYYVDNRQNTKDGS